MIKPSGLIVPGLCLLALTAPRASAGDPDWIARGKTGMVASDSPEASRIGADVLSAGGNAFDAAVAVSFALSVARPQSTGLGGGGLMVAYSPGEKRFVTLDFRETAPAGADARHYAALHAQADKSFSPSVHGGAAVAVPGQLAGLAEINRRFGTRSLADLIAPAVALAEEGFVVDQSFLDARTDVAEDLNKSPRLKRECRAIVKMLALDGDAPKIGDKFKRPDYAELLKLIAKDGPKAFYSGPLAGAIAEAALSQGGLLTTADLAQYRVKEREPLRINRFDALYQGGYEFVSMPPPSSGGVCHAEILNILAACMCRSDLHPEYDREHVLVEAMKHAFADRARWLGDADFFRVPVAGLTSSGHAAALAREITQKTRFWSEYGSAEAPPDDGGTSHFCVADKDGAVVSLTETVNGYFGSLVVVEPYGLILNNEMDDFLTARNQANMFGLMQGEANLVAPGKRPLSSMSPTIVLKDGRPFLAIGGSGGPRIITSTLQVALHLMEGRSLEEAMTAPRMHHQWQPDEIKFDRAPPADMVERLTARGHVVSAKRKTGVVQAIQFLSGGVMVGASDPQKGGKPAAAN